MRGKFGLEKGMDFSDKFKNSTVSDGNGGVKDLLLRKLMI